MWKDMIQAVSHKDVIQAASYIFAMLAALVAAWSYRKSVRLDRVKWAAQLFERFYEQERYKRIREVLDCEAGAAEAVDSLVLEQSAEFTDYLNFFEFVAFLAKERQVPLKYVTRLFDYYLKCLCRHRSVREYVEDQGRSYECLRWLLHKSKNCPKM